MFQQDRTTEYCSYHLPHCEFPPARVVDLLIARKDKRELMMLLGIQKTTLEFHNDFLYPLQGKAPSPIISRGLITPPKRGWNIPSWPNWFSAICDLTGPTHRTGASTKRWCLSLTSFMSSPNISRTHSLPGDFCNALEWHKSSCWWVQKFGKLRDKLPPGSLTANYPWKMRVGKLLSFWDR